MDKSKHDVEKKKKNKQNSQDDAKYIMFKKWGKPNYMM